MWLLLLALTGSAITFYDELDRWLNPDWRTIPAGEPVRLDVDGALASAATVPGFIPRFVDLPNAPGETVLMAGSVGERAAQVFIDPRDNRLLGWRLGDTLAFDRRHLMDALYELHLDLMLGETMAWFLGLVALLWTLDHIAAAVLAVPRLSKWRDALHIKGTGLRRLYDLHRAPGLWLLPVTFVLALTGWTLTWHDESRAVVRLAAPVSERLHYEFPETEEAVRIGANAALAVARGRGIGDVDSLLPLPRYGAWGIRSHDPRDLDGYGRMWTYVSSADGRVLGQRHDNGSGPGDTFFAWQYPLHSGKAFGLWGRIAVFVGGLATAALCVTGVALWWRRARFR